MPWLADVNFLLALFDADHNWPDDTSLLDSTAFDHTKIKGHRQITDAYLLSLAVKHNGRLVTFDGQIPLSAAHGATKRHLVIL